MRMIPDATPASGGRNALAFLGYLGASYVIWDTANRTSVQEIRNCPTAKALAAATTNVVVQWTYYRIRNDTSAWMFNDEYALAYHNSGTGCYIKISDIASPSQRLYTIDGLISSPAEKATGCVGAWTSAAISYTGIQNSMLGSDYDGVAGFIHGSKANMSMSDGHVEGRQKTGLTQSMCDLLY